MKKEFWNLCLLLSTLIWFGCSSPGSGENNERNSNSIVNADGEAWTDSHTRPAGDREGFIFNSDGSFRWIEDYTGRWTVVSSGTWSIDGNTATLTLPYVGTVSGTYRVSGNYLTFNSQNWGSYDLRKTSVTIGAETGKDESERPEIPEGIIGRWHYYYFVPELPGINFPVDEWTYEFTAEGLAYVLDRTHGYRVGEPWVYPFEIRGREIFLLNTQVNVWTKIGFYFENGQAYADIAMCDENCRVYLTRHPSLN